MYVLFDCVRVCVFWCVFVCFRVVAFVFCVVLRCVSCVVVASCCVQLDVVVDYVFLCFGLCWFVVFVRSVIV